LIQIILCLYFISGHSLIGFTDQLISVTKTAAAWQPWFDAVSVLLRGALQNVNNGTGIGDYSTVPTDGLTRATLALSSLHGIPYSLIVPGAGPNQNDKSSIGAYLNQTQTISINLFLVNSTGIVAGSNFTYLADILINGEPNKVSKNLLPLLLRDAYQIRHSQTDTTCAIEKLFLNMRSS
jgi:hypothetical protein